MTSLLVHTALYMDRQWEFFLFQVCINAKAKVRTWKLGPRTWNITKNS